MPADLHYLSLDEVARRLKARKLTSIAVTQATLDRIAASMADALITALTRPSAAELAEHKHGELVRTAGLVLLRQRPGTAKGVCFITLEDETGVSNIIVRPDLFDRERMSVIRQPFLLVEGVLQHQDGVLSVKAERLRGIDGGALAAQATIKRPYLPDAAARLHPVTGLRSQRSGLRLRRLAVAAGRLGSSLGC